MEFLKIYDVTERLINAEKVGELYVQAEGYILGYFIQEDVHDYHVYRIIKGTYDEEYEGREDEVLTVEHQKIDKSDVLDVYKIAANTRQQRDKKIDGLSQRKIINAVIQLDNEDGMSNWDYKVVEDMDEAISLITEDDFYKIAKLTIEEAV